MLNTYINFQNLNLGEAANMRECGKILGTSDCNSYVPFFIINNHTLLDIAGNIVIEYYKPVYHEGVSYSRNYAQLFSSLSSNTSNTKHYIISEGDTHTIGVNRNILFDSNGHILMCVGIKTEILLQYSLREIGLRQDPTDFVLFISPEFEENSIYKNIYKRVVTEYVSLFKDGNVDVIYSKNIDGWMFKNNYTPPIFNSVPEMMKHLNEEVVQILIDN